MENDQATEIGKVVYSLSVIRTMSILVRRDRFGNTLSEFCVVVML